MTRALRRTLLRNWNRLLGSLFHRNANSDLSEEFDSHIRLLAEEDIRRGVPEEEAHRRARLRFGSVEATKESYRDQRGLPLLDAFAQDLRYAFRGLRRNRSFATVAILSLAIGIGANTAIFSVVNAVLLRALAYKDPQRLFAVREISPLFAALGPVGVNPVHAREWAIHCPSVEQATLVRGGPAQVAGGSEPVSVPGARVPHNFFAVLGVAPILGRTFLPEEEQQGNDRVAIISESLWRSRFDGDPLLVGKSVLIDGEKHEVAGVVSASFRPPYAPAAGVFRPLALSPQESSRRTGNYA